MSNVLSEEKRQQVIALGRLGWSLRRIQGTTGIRRETASEYLRSAGIAIRAPGRWGRSEAKPAIQVSHRPGHSRQLGEGKTGHRDVHRVQSIDQCACEAHREFIESSLAKGRNAMAIWQDLVDGHRFTHAYASVRRFAAKLRVSAQKDACAIIVTAPGEEAQVDYGSGPMVRDAKTGKYRRTRLFVLTLGYSRKAIRLLAFTSSSRTWAELHEKAFARLGGTPRTIVLDNLRGGVIKPDLYDPALKRVYADMLVHYSVTALPCRIRHPDRKGKVESAVGHAQKTP